MLITTNVVRVLELPTASRHLHASAARHHRVQTGDGYAAHVAGRVVGAPIGVTTTSRHPGGRPRDRNGAAFADRVVRGNTVLAATKIAEWASDDVNITGAGLISRTTPCGPRSTLPGRSGRSYGVLRLDTSEMLVDRSLWEEMVTSSRPA